MDLAQRKLPKLVMLRAYYETLYRFYIGCQPCMLVSDLEILKQILIKDFDNFTNRLVLWCAYNVTGNYTGVFSLQDLINLRVVSTIAHKGLYSAQGDYWRRSRRILTPTFSTLKLKVVGSCDLCLSTYYTKCTYYSRWCPSCKIVWITLYTGLQHRVTVILLSMCSGWYMYNNGLCVNCYCSIGWGNMFTYCVDCFAICQIYEAYHIQYH